MMVIGLLFGAWTFHRGGKRAVLFVACTWMTLSILDHIFGWQTGKTLATATLHLFGYEAKP